MSRLFDTMILLLVLLPPTVTFFVPLPPRSSALCRQCERRGCSSSSSSSSRRGRGTVSMEIPAELEGQLDPTRVWDVKFTLNGETKTVAVSEETSLLEAAEEVFEDVVYSCRSGVCNSCSGKCSGGDKGSFAVAVESLSDEYVEKGYILTCTTYPTGPGLHVILNQQEEMLGIA